MKKAIIYLSLPLGLLLISLPLLAQGLMPGVQIDSLKTWAITFFVGASFMVIWYMIKRWIALTDRLNDSIGILSHETKMHRQEALVYAKDIDILKKRVNGFNDWRNKHNLIHAKCPNCPEIPNDTKDEADQ